MKAFVTGSRKYGKPTKKSDTDLVIRISDAEYHLLRLLADKTDGRKGASGSLVDFIPSLRFGSLNLICCTTDKQYAAWKEGTKELMERKEGRGEPIQRDEAVRLFTQIRKAAGLQR